VQCKSEGSLIDEVLVIQENKALNAKVYRR
jgi:hypothetical protein